MRSRYHPYSPGKLSARPHYSLYAGERLRLLFSPERLRGEFIVCAYRFTPPTGSLESDIDYYSSSMPLKFSYHKNNNRAKSSCFILPLVV